MSNNVRMIRRVAGTVLLVAIGISPFAIYVGARSFGESGGVDWPAGVAVSSVKGTELAGLSWLTFTPKPVVVRFPPESALFAATMGRLRAVSAFKIGGPSLMARSLSDTFQTVVPYWLQTEGAGTTEQVTSSGAGSHEREITDLLAQAGQGRIPTIIAPGTFSERDGIRFYTLDVRRLLDQLAGRLTVATPSPTPSPSTSFLASPSPGPSFSRVSVEILNQGAPAGSATQIAAKLKEAGFTKVTTATSRKSKVTGVRVYYKQDREAAVAIADVLGGVAVLSRIPGSYDTAAEILIVVGAEESNEPPPTRRRTSEPSSSPEPSTDVTLS